MTIKDLRDARFTVAMTWIGYTVLFLPLHAWINDVAVIFLLVPAIATGWIFGMRGAVISVVTMWPLQALLYLGADHGFGLDLYAGWGGLIGMGGVTALTLLAGLASRRVAGLTKLHAAKDRMVASVSHEVRNPLTGVLGMAELLDADWEGLGNEDRRELVSTIAGQAREAALIIEDLLVVARMGSGVELPVYPEPVDLATVAGTVAAHAGAPMVLSTEPAVAYADPTRTRQVVANLVSNAAKYGGPNRRIETGSSGGTVWLEVSDDGDGVDPEVINVLFEPFSAADRSDATGIGLAVSKTLAEAMDGDLTYSREDGETRFRLSLPAASWRTQATPSGSGASEMRASVD